MPFEGDIADFAPTTAPPIETPEQSVIRRARELISDPAHWLRTWQSGDAFCILGALRYAHHGDVHRPGTGGAQDYVMRVLKRMRYTGITTFNDRHASHGQVLAVLDAAYELAGKPKRAKLELSRSLVRAHFGHDLLLHEPLPPPVRLSDQRATVADIVERISASAAPVTCSAFRRSAGPLSLMIEEALLSALKFAFRRAV